MADDVAGGAPGSGMPAYMYEDLKKMVYADDPDAVRAVGEWLLDRGRLISEFAATVHRELSRVDDLYSSAEGAPALKAQLYRAFDELQSLGSDLIHNGHVLIAAADAIGNTRSQVDAVYPKVKPGEAVFRGTSAYTDPPSQKAQPYVEALNSYLYELGDTLALMGASLHDSPPPPISGGSNPGTSPGGAGPGSGPSTNQGSGRPDLSGGRETQSSRGTFAPPGPVLGGQPSSRGTVTGPGGGLLTPGLGGSPAGKAGTGVGAPGAGTGRQIRIPGARSGDLMGRMRPPAAGVGAGGAPGIGEPPGKVPSPEAIGPEGPGATQRPNAVPPGGDPGVGNSLPPGGHAGHGGQRRRGRKRSGYERGEPDTFVDGRYANEVGGNIRGTGLERPTDPGPAVIGSQKHRHTDDQGHSQWELSQTAPSREGFPDEFQEGSFRRKDGVQFEVRRRVGGA